MYRYFKKPEVPTSSPDAMTFPFEFSPFQFTMENYVRSYTRKRVTKENLSEVLEEVNTAIKSHGDSFKTWDLLSVLFLLVLDVGILVSILTLKLDQTFLLAIKISSVFIGFIVNFVVYLCCLNGSATRLRDKIQEILDSKDEYFESKGMRWTVAAENDFPFWIELHIQSQFEMKLKQEKEEAQGKKKETQNGTNYSENKGILNGKNSKAVAKKPNKKGFVNLEEEFNEEDEDNEYENQAQVEAEVDIEAELDQVEDEEQPGPNPHSQPPQQEIHLEIKNGKNGKNGKEGKTGKKFDRLYAPLDEDYEENYNEEEEASP